MPRPSPRRARFRAVPVAVAGAAALAFAAAAVLAAESSAAAAAAGPTSWFASHSPTASYAPGSVLVRFRTGASPRTRAGLLRSLGARTARSIADLGVDVLHVPAGAEQHVVTALQRSGTVDFAEPDGMVRVQGGVVPNDPYWPKQWGPGKIGAPQAWSTTTGSRSVVIAVLDTGLDTSLAEFAGRTLPGYNFVSNTTDVTDDNSHGTSVTGVLAAQGDNATAVAGLCWSCSILPVKVMDASGNGTTSEVASGITWATDHGARVINLSLGGTTGSAAEADAVAYAESKGVLVVAGSGNNSSSAAFYPAAYPGVLSVGASDQLDRLYSYSDYGSWVDVAAPGSGYSVWPGGNCFNFSGTSAAAPVVAGLAGLLLSADPTATPTEISAAITQNTDPLSAGTVASGRVDAAKALAALTGTSPSGSSTPTSSAPVSPASSAPTSPSSSGAPAPSSSAPSSTSAPSSSSAPSPTPTSTATGPTTVTYSGSVNAKATKSYALTTSGGAVQATVSGVSSTVTVAIVTGSGSTVASANGGSGTSVSGVVPAGSFSVVITSPAKTKLQVTVTYYS